MPPLQTDPRYLHEKVAELADFVKGGPQVPFDRSILGRLEKVETYVRDSDALVAAARDLRRVKDRRLTRFERTALLAFGAVTALAALVGAVGTLVALFA